MENNLEEGFVKITENYRERNSPVWDMSQERALNDNLLGQRFNFFIVVFSFVIAGFVNAKTQEQLLIILASGSLICVLLARMVARTHKKLNIILTILSADLTHPFTIIEQAKNNATNKAKTTSWMNDVGIWIPRLCCLILIVCFVLALMGIPHVPYTRPETLSQPMARDKSNSSSCSCANGRTPSTQNTRPETPSQPETQNKSKKSIRN